MEKEKMKIELEEYNERTEDKKIILTKMEKHIAEKIVRAEEKYEIGEKKKM